MSSISAVMPKGGLADPSVWKKPRRTFEEIVKELAENPAITSMGIKLINVRPADSGSGGLADFTDIDGFGELTLYDDGGISMKYREDWTWQSLAAISAACSEIAANYAAEHGKEDAR